MSTTTIESDKGQRKNPNECHDNQNNVNEKEDNLNKKKITVQRRCLKVFMKR